jgi:aryl-alcohol dehydrogenase-like predicted oxidoreductase
LVHRREFEEEHRAMCRLHVIGVLAYSPLAGGFLTGKYAQGAEPPAGSRAASGGRVRDYLDRAEMWRTLEVVQRIGKVKGWTASQVALAWVLDQPGITSAIIGPRSLEQWEDNLGAFNVDLSSEDMEALDQVSGWNG